MIDKPALSYDWTLKNRENTSRCRVSLLGVNNGATVARWNTRTQHRDPCLPYRFRIFCSKMCLLCRRFVCWTVKQANFLLTWSYFVLLSGRYRFVATIVCCCQWALWACQMFLCSVFIHMENCSASELLSNGGDWIQFLLAKLWQRI